MDTSATSANHVLSPLKRMLNLAVKWELIEKNPAGAQEKFKKDSGDTIPINWRHMRLLHSKPHVSPYYLYCVPGTFARNLPEPPSGNMPAVVVERGRSIAAVNKIHRGQHRAPAA